MKKLKINKLNIIILAGLLLIGFLYYHYGTIRYFGSHKVSTSPITNEENENLGGFRINPQRENISSISIYLFREHYIPNEENIDLILSIKSLGVDREKRISLSKISKGYNQFNFSPEIFTNGEEIEVGFDLSEKLKKDNMVFVHNQDFVPDQHLDNSPIVTYEEKISTLAQEILDELMEDEKFAILYSVLLATVALLALVLVIFRLEDE